MDTMHQSALHFTGSAAAKVAARSVWVDKDGVLDVLGSRRPAKGVACGPALGCRRHWAKMSAWAAASRPARPQRRSCIGNVLQVFRTCRLGESG